MIIKIRNRSHHYISIDKRPLMDKRLSFKARGILAYCLTQPAHLRISMDHLIEQSADGKWSIKSAFKELAQFGYAKIENLRHKNGQIFGQQWVIYESPNCDRE